MQGGRGDGRKTGGRVRDNDFQEDGPSRTRTGGGRSGAEKGFMNEDVLDVKPLDTKLPPVNFDVWGPQFAMESLPALVKEKLIRACPILLGSSGLYPPSWFEKELGLPGKGLLSKELNERNCPERWIQAKWPKGQDNRYCLKSADPEFRGVVTEMYFRVYGNMPDNSTVSLTFLRGVYLYWYKRLEVN